VRVPRSNIVKNYRDRWQSKNHETKIQSNSPSTLDVPMSGNVYPLGIYYIEIDVGTPGRSFNVAVDTGSCTLLIPGVKCKGCPPQEPDHLYDPTASSSSKPFGCRSADECRSCGGPSGSQCIFSNSYETCNLSNPDQICTVEGLVFSEVFKFGNLNGNIVLGSIEKQTQNFQQFSVIDGVLGLACTTSFGQYTPVQYLYKHGEMANQFSFCFDKSGNGGIFTFGGADPNLYTGTFTYTPFVQTIEEGYLVKMKDLLVGGKSIGVNPNVYSGGFGGSIIDSGTNIFLLPDPAFRALHKTFRALCSTTQLKGICDKNATHTLFDGYCFKLTSDDLSKFPTMTISLEGVTLTMKPTQYLVVETTPGIYCLGVINTGEGGFTILGDTVLNPYVSLFDRQNLRLGFAPVNPSTCLSSNLK